jgi:hypothetical protein
MKFFATPKHYVKISNKYIQRVTGLKGFYFDANGEYVTSNPRIINALKTHFKFEDDTLDLKCEIEPLNVQEIATETIEVEVVEKKLKHCKKCDFTCENQGELMAHYRLHKGGKR